MRTSFHLCLNETDFKMYSMFGKCWRSLKVSSEEVNLISIKMKKFDCYKSKLFLLSKASLTRSDKM